MSSARYQENPDADNYACGSCQRTQDPGEGQRCIKCGKPTVTWLKSQRETWDECLKKWRRYYG